MGELREELEAEHRRLDEWLRAAVTDPDRFDHASFEAFRAGLLRHIGIEEKILFAHLRRTAAPFPEEARLRIEHGALAALLVPTPDHALVREIRTLLDGHNRVEEGADGVYDVVDRATGAELPEMLARVRAAPPVRLAPHRDGPRSIRSAEEALRLQRSTGR